MRSDCRAENLRWATWEEQIADRDAHGHYFHVIGEDHPMRVLDDALVLELRRRWRSDNCTIKSLAKEVGHKYLTVYDAVKGTTWKHLPQ